MKCIDGNRSCYFIVGAFTGGVASLARSSWDLAPSVREAEQQFVSPDSSRVLFRRQQNKKRILRHVSLCLQGITLHESKIKSESHGTVIFVNA